jgi:mRNA interferase RelE/StbE
MNPHKLVIKATAERDFDNIDAKSKEWIVSAIDNLKIVPFPRGCRHIKSAGREFFRIRVGNYRVIYSWSNLTRTITINHIRLRDEHTYEKL